MSRPTDSTIRQRQTLGALRRSVGLTALVMAALGSYAWATPSTTFWGIDRGPAGSVSSSSTSPARPGEVRSPDDGHALRRGRGALLPPLVALRARLRSGLGRQDMSLEYAVGILLSVLMLAYLAYALLRPERF